MMWLSLVRQAGDARRSLQATRWSDRRDLHRDEMEAPAPFLLRRGL